jgi:phage tail-like protein
MADAAPAPPAPAPAAGAQPGAPVDPYRAYNFKLIIQGVAQGHFTECTGLGVKIEDIKYREGGENQVVRRLPGRVEYCDVTLKYGLTNSPEIWQWFMKALEGTVDRRNPSIALLDFDGRTEVMRWNLYNAWPSAWRGAQLNASGSEAAIESVTLVFERLDRDPGGAAAAGAAPAPAGG